MSRVDWIKIDVEGGEALALDGASRTLRAHRPSIVIEYSPDLLEAVSKVKGEDFLARLVSERYEISVLDCHDAGTLHACGTDIGQIVRHYRRQSGTHIDLLATPLP